MELVLGGCVIDVMDTEVTSVYQNTPFQSKS